MNIGISNRKVINDFRDLVADKMQVSEDSGWSTRLVFQHLLNTRARLLYEKAMNRKKKLSQHVFQTIPCIPMERIDTTECPCAPANGCIFTRTILAIPKPIGMLTLATTVDGFATIDYTYVDWDKFKYKLNPRLPFEANRPYYTLKTIGDYTYLYLYNDKYRKLVSITGVFEAPLEVQFYPDCEGKVPTCQRPLDKPFLIDADLLPLMYDMTFKMLVPLKYQAGLDLMNNDSDDNPVTQIPPK